MKSFFIFIGVVFFSFGALAAESKAVESNGRQWHGTFIPLSKEFRYERDKSQQMVTRAPMNLALGAGKGATDILFEYSSFTESSGNDTLSITRKHQEYSFWWKEKFKNLGALDFFASGGLGVYQEKVTTTLVAIQSTTDTSAFQTLAGVSGGLQILMFRCVLASIEARIMAGQNFDPNPQGSVLLRVGVQF